jgi:hypothetical protein
MIPAAELRFGPRLKPQKEFVRSLALWMELTAAAMQAVCRIRSVSTEGERLKSREDERDSRDIVAKRIKQITDN